MNTGTVIDGRGTTGSGNDTNSQDIVFDIGGALEETSQEAFDDLNNRFEETAVDENSQIPLLSIFGTGILNSKSTGLINCIVIGQALEDWIVENGHDHVRCENLSVIHTRLVRDVCEEHDVKVSLANRHQLKRRALDDFKYYIRKLMRTGVLLADQVFALLVGLVRRQRGTSDIVFIPYPGREESMRPVIQTLADCRGVSVVRTSLKLPAVLSSSRSGSKGDGTNTVCYYHDFTSVRTLARITYGLFVHTPVAVLLRKTEQRLLAEEIEAAVGLRLDRSIDWAYFDNVMKGQRAIPYYFLTERLIERTDCQCLVVGGDTPREKAITTKTTQRGVNTYYIPHSLIARYEPEHSTATWTFASSEREMQFLEHIGRDTRLMYPAGRPYLGELRGSPADMDSTDDHLTLLIATQGLFPDYIRKELVECVLEGGEQMDDMSSVIVKTHPAEDPAFYRDILRNQLSDFDIPVYIVNTGLEELLRQADLTVTITSNVGLESIALGTPTVVIDKWGGRSYSPRYPYQELSPVPILESDLAVEDFFEDITESSLQILLAKQTEFFEQTYPEPEEATEEIVDRLLSECAS